MTAAGRPARRRRPIIQHSIVAPITVPAHRDGGQSVPPGRSEASVKDAAATAAPITARRDAEGFAGRPAVQQIQASAAIPVTIAIGSMWKCDFVVATRMPLNVKTKVMDPGRSLKVLFRRSPVPAKMT